MSTIRSIELVAPTPKDGVFTAYNRDFIANKPFTQVPGMPFVWLKFRYRQSVTPSIGTTDDGNGKTKVTFTDGGGLGIQTIKVGDMVFYTTSSGPALPGAIAILVVHEQTSTTLTVTLDLDFGDYPIDAGLAFWFVYIGRASELLPIKVSSTDKTYLPNQSLKVVNSATLANICEAIGIDLQEPAIAMMPRPVPVGELVIGNRSIALSVSYGLTGSSYTTTDAYVINNALETPVLALPTVFANTYFASNIIGGKAHRLRFCLPDGRTVDQPLWSVSDAFTAGLRPIRMPNYDGQDIDAIPDSMVTLVPRLGALWVLFQSRYGGYDLACFRYDLTKEVATTSNGQYRQGYKTYDLGKVANESISISSGPLYKGFAILYEDLQRSNICFIATEVRTIYKQSIYYIDYDAMHWREATIEDSTIIYDQARSNIIEFTARLNYSEILKSYRS